MRFDKIYEAYNWFRRYKPIEGLKEKINGPGPDTTGKWEFGNWVMFQHVKGDYNKEPSISRPILAIFTGWSIWDQAPVINFIEEYRAWTYSNHMKMAEEIEHKQYSNRIAFWGDPATQQIALWDDEVNCLGHWKNKPTKQELRAALLKQL